MITKRYNQRVHRIDTPCYQFVINGAERDVHRQSRDTPRLTHTVVDNDRPLHILYRCFKAGTGLKKPARFNYQGAIP